MLKLIALGTGVCADTQHTKTTRQPPGFLIEEDGFFLLLDCSEGVRFRLKAMGVEISRVTHVAVTHGHPDHAALPHFIQSKYVALLAGATDPRATQLRLFLPQRLEQSFPHLWKWHYPEHNGNYWSQFTPELVGMSDGFSEELAPGMMLRAQNVYHGHGRHPAMGFRVETPRGVIVYTGDTGVCDSLPTLARNADLLIADCSERIGQDYTGGYGHMTPRQCGELARKAQVTCLWLTHYFDYDAPEAMIAEARATGFSGDVRVARDGDEWEA